VTLAVVLSNGRSGSSLVCGILAKHGLWFGHVKPADERNPKGFYENSAIYNRASAMYGNMRKGIETARDDGKWQAAFNEVIERQGYVDGPLMVKHTPAHYKIWQPLNPIFITVRRSMEGQIKSRENLAWLIDHDNLQHKENIMNALEMHKQSIRIDSDALVGGDYRQIESVLNRIGIALDPQIVKDFIEPEYWHYGA